jgi:hypothetical protein
MFSNSVIRKTGQWWKLVVGTVVLLVGSIVPAFEASGMSWTVGTILAVLGYGFIIAFIRCPSCELRWFWKALLYAEMYGPLFKKAACPDCAHDFGGTDAAD